MSERNRVIYQKFERLLKENNVSANEVARATGISKGTLSAWKHDTYDIKLNTLEKIANYFKVSILYFLE